ncbi:MAG: hypothetical protein ACE15B_06955 [Bryobacteraceae bacterium]
MGGRLSIRYDVAAARENRDAMFFSIGNHITFRVPFAPGSEAGAMELETPSTVESLKTPEGLPAGESRPRSLTPPVRLADFDARTAVSLGGYSGNPRLRLKDPAGPLLTISHEASALPPAPLVQSNLWGDPGRGYFSPEPWAGLQNSLVLRRGVVALEPSREFHWRIELRPEF